MRVLLFAAHKDQFGPELLLPKDVTTVSELLATLQATHANARPAWAHCRVAVNQQLIDDDSLRTLHATDEVAIIPPVSGG